MTPNEALAKQVRRALGRYNDPHEDVVSLVRRLAEAADGHKIYLPYPGAAARQEDAKCA